MRRKIKGERRKKKPFVKVFRGERAGMKKEGMEGEGKRKEEKGMSERRQRGDRKGEKKCKKITFEKGLGKKKEKE